MKIGAVDFTQASTIRGLVWLAFAVVGSVGWLMDKDLSVLSVFAAAVAGGIGVVVKD